MKDMFGQEIAGIEVNGKKKNQIDKTETDKHICSCAVCGRILTNENSVEKGIGPVCDSGRIEDKFIKAKERQRDLFQTKSDYMYGLEDGVLWIRDLNRGGMSVTNNIVNVLQEIQIETKIEYGKVKIMYQDSQGIWDGVKVNEKGGIVQYYSIHEKDYEKAKMIIKGRETREKKKTREDDYGY